MSPHDISRRRFVEDTLRAGLALGLADACAHVAPTPSGSAARFRSAGGDLTLSNDAISASWRVDGATLRGLEAVDLLTGERMRLSDSSISLVLADGTTLDTNA